MADPTLLPLTASRAEQIFPTLRSAQIQRLVRHGHVRSVHVGEVRLNVESILRCARQV
jgi:hypothetical protein